MNMGSPTNNKGRILLKRKCKHLLVCINKPARIAHNKSNCFVNPPKRLGSLTPVNVRSALESDSNTASSPQLEQMALMRRWRFINWAMVSSPTSYNKILSILSHVIEKHTIKSTNFVPWVHLKSHPSPVHDQRSVTITEMRGGPSI